MATADETGGGTTGDWRGAFPMPLGSKTALGFAGPAGTPLIAESPAHADPAGGVSCADAGAVEIRLPSAKRRANTKLRAIHISHDCGSNGTRRDQVPTRLHLGRMRTSVRG